MLQTRGQHDTHTHTHTMANMHSDTVLPAAATIGDRGRAKGEPGGGIAAESTAASTPAKRWEAASDATPSESASLSEASSPEAIFKNI